MNTKKLIIIIGGIMAVILAAGLAERARGTEDTPQATIVQPAQKEAGSLTCSPAAAYVLTKRWVQHVEGSDQLTFPSFDEGFVEHDQAGDAYTVRAYYLVDGRKVEFYGQVRCSGDHWKAESLTVNGRHFNGSDEWV